MSSNDWKIYHNILFNNNQQGDGIIDDFLNTRPRKVNNFMSKYARMKIINISICRVPLNSKIKFILNLFTNGKVNEIKKRYNYDEIFHLYLLFTLENGERYLIEKNEVVSIKKFNNQYKKGDCKSKNIIVMFGGMIIKSEKNYTNMYKYSAHNDNCQKFIKTLLNNIGIFEFDDFIMQYHANEILTGSRKKISQIITNIAGIGRRFIGAGI